MDTLIAKYVASLIRRTYAFPYLFLNKQKLKIKIKQNKKN